MLVKKFQGATENEAMLQVKEEMGSQAVVLNVKTIKHRGLMRLFKGNIVEVTAALGENEDEQVPTKQTESHFEARVDENFSKDLSEVAAKVERSIEESGQEMSYTRNVERKTNDRSAYDTAIEERLNSLQVLLERQLNKEEEKEKEEEAEASEENDELLKFKRLVYNTMLDNEVKEQYINQIIDEINHSNISQDAANVDVMLANIYQKMILKFGSATTIQPAENGPKILFFVGPTGVGKTTTIAKLSSKLKLEDKKQIAMLTTDTYRIAAAEQLRTYSDILDTPFQVIYTPEELSDAVAELMEYDYILVDTAGHSPNNLKRQEDLLQFVYAMSGEFEKEIYLVVSATTKYTDLVNIVNQYGDVGKYKLIFTKLDETMAWGNILNLRMYTNADIAFMTNGQNVPDDIGGLDAQAIVRKLLGGR